MGGLSPHENPSILGPDNIWHVRLLADAGPLASEQMKYA